MKRLLCIVILAMMLTGRKTKQPIVQTRDSVRVEYRHDSVFVWQHDSIFRDRWRNGDTVFVTVEKWQTRWREKTVEIHDTLRTSEVQVQEVKYVPNYYKRVSTGFWVLLGILVLIVGFWCVKLYMKMQTLIFEALR